MKIVHFLFYVKFKTINMGKKTIREVIKEVPYGEPQSIPLSEIEIEGYRAEAARLNKESRDSGETDIGNPHYSISVNKRVGLLYVINNLN